MAFKFVVLAAMVTASNAGLLPQPFGYPSYPPAARIAVGPAYSPPIAKIANSQPYILSDEEHDPHPQYNFAYDVQDSLTGDSKSQQESREGGVVRGSYSLIDADGFKRTVEYTADPVNGFNAVVHRQPLGQSVKILAKPPVSRLTSSLHFAHAGPVGLPSRIASPLPHTSHVAKLSAPLSFEPHAHRVVAHKFTAPLSYPAHTKIAYPAPSNVH